MTTPLRLTGVAGWMDAPGLGVREPTDRLATLARLDRGDALRFRLDNPPREA